jgi:hypothetical protein
MARCFCETCLFSGIYSFCWIVYIGNLILFVVICCRPAGYAHFYHQSGNVAFCFLSAA